MEPICANAVRYDMIYINESLSKFSMVKLNDEYMKYTEGIAKKFAGFCLDSNRLWIISKSAIKIDIEQLKELFSSKDIDRYEQLKSTWFGSSSLFLDKSKNQNNIVTYCTYPRSGNSMMRKHFENVTGIATGSDLTIRFYMNVALQYSGFKAEGVTDNSIWINKTHFPFNIPVSTQYESDLALCCVRNPIDVFVSFYTMILG